MTARPPSAVYTLLFLWLALTGGMWGWGNISLAINAWLSVGLVAAWLWARPPAKPLTWPLLAFWAVNLISLAINGQTNAAWLWLLLVGVAVYQLSIINYQLSKGALYAGLVYFPLSLVLPENGNVIAFNIWALYFLAGPRGRFWGLAAITAMAFTGSEGGLLALAGGMLHRRWGWRGVGLGLLVALFVGWLKAETIPFTHRLELLRHAINGFTASPLIGHGPGAYHALTQSGWSAWHSHNLLTDIAYTTGLAGLLALAWLIWKMKDSSFILYPSSFIIAFLIHSLVDGPIYFFLPLIGLFIILGGLSYGATSRNWKTPAGRGPGLAHRHHIPRY